MRTPLLALAVAVVLVLGGSRAAWAADKPNVLLIFVDDMGWAQPGCYGGKLAPTPNIDALAAGGVRFTDGYTSGCVCTPSRVGLMTGRYQARTGHDANTNPRPGSELVLTETTMAQRMKAAGYTTGIVGKWHLGYGPEHLPAARGFDHSYGTLGNLGEGEGPTFYRGTRREADPPGAPITSPIFAKEAAAFVEAHAGKPWFLYLALNAVHSPHVASPKWMERFAALPNKRDQQYAALTAEMDEAVGTVMAKVRERKLEEDTLVFFISDNGGAAPQAEMAGLRGGKWNVWEGGVRVSWIAAWKGRVPGGRVAADPVIQLDVLPTALAAAGAEVKPEWQLDGVNLLPLLEGKAEKLAPRELYFRFGAQHAVRSGDWKLVKAAKDMDPMLVNLKDDRGEQTDLSARHPEKKQELQKLYDVWNARMQPPRWEDRRWDGEAARKAQKERKQQNPDRKAKKKGEQKDNP